MNARDARNVILRNLHFENCKSNEGSPIELKGAEVALKDCIFEGNRAFRGGSISVFEGSNLTVKNSSFLNNTAVVGGGAIFVDSTAILKVSDSIFSQNTIKSFFGDGKGGAVFCANDEVFVNLAFSGCQFERNEADHGGGVYLFGLYESTFEDCEFIDNHAAQQGGAVLVNGSESSISEIEPRYGSCSFLDSSFEGNSAKFGGAIGFLPGTNGTLLDSTFKQNNATNGGAIYLFNDTAVESNGSDFLQNVAKENGGAVYVHCSSAFYFLTFNFFRGAPPSFQMTGGSCNQNEAWNGGCIAAVNETKIAAYNTEIAGNKVSSIGGGIYALRVRSVDLEGVDIENNIAYSGGGIFIDSSLVVLESLYTPIVGKAIIALKNCNFSSNQADVGDGGGLFAIDAVNMTIKNGNFLKNEANGNGGGMALFSSSYDRNGSLHHILNRVSVGRVSDSGVYRSTMARSFDVILSPEAAGIIPMMTVELTSVIFSKNEGNFGGGIVAQSGCLINAKDVRFVRNSATYVGAAYILNSILFCDRCEVLHNRATFSAGGFSIQVRFLPKSIFFIVK